MLKIKFNMMFNCEQIQIRTLDDLRNNFFVEDVLRSFDDGTLERWLDARYYTHELKAVKELKASGKTNAREILEALIKIFAPEIETAELEAELSMYDYLEERKKFWEYVRDNGLNEIEILRKKVKALESELYTQEDSTDDEEESGEGRNGFMRKFRNALSRYEALSEEANKTRRRI